MSDKDTLNTGSSNPCKACIGNTNAEAAFQSLNAQTVKGLISESHFSVRLTRCECGHPFVVVFTECVDWKNGEDDQSWLALPLQEDEFAKLAKASEKEIYGQVASLGDRRFLSRTYPTGGELGAEWCDGGFQIGHHD